MLLETRAWYTFQFPRKKLYNSKMVDNNIQNNTGRKKNTTGSVSSRALFRPPAVGSQPISSPVLSLQSSAAAAVSKDTSRSSIGYPEKGTFAAINHYCNGLSQVIAATAPVFHSCVGSPTHPNTLFWHVCTQQKTKSLWVIDCVQERLRFSYPYIWHAVHAEMKIVLSLGSQNIANFSQGL